MINLFMKTHVFLILSCLMAANTYKISAISLDDLYEQLELLNTCYTRLDNIKYTGYIDQKLQKDNLNAIKYYISITEKKISEKILKVLQDGN
jgi:hypothetical protein